MTPRRSLALILAAVSAAVLLPVASPASALSLPAPTCGGEPATIVSADPFIVGTPGDDVILATGSSPQNIRGGAGDDVICGSPAADRIFGGAGDDVIYGGSGPDVIDGWTGDDTIYGNLGRDTISGGSGDDHVMGGIGDDTITGNTGTDMLAGGGGSDMVRGGAGSDSLDGGNAPDTLEGGAGYDFCRGDAADTMMGDCTIDRTGPAITDFSLPASVRAGDTMTFTWRVADPNGVTNTQFSIGGTPGWITEWCGFQAAGELVGGTMYDGVYQASCTLPTVAVNATYTLFFSASDSFGNGSPWDSSTQFDFVVTDGSNDTGTVDISDVTVERVDDGDIVVRYRASDESGVAGAWVYLAWGGDDPSGNVYYSFASWYGLHLDAAIPERVSGDEFDGVWEQRFSLRPFTPAGVYGVWISSRDLVGNRLFTSYGATIWI